MRKRFIVRAVPVVIVSALLGTMLGQSLASKHPANKFAKPGTPGNPITLDFGLDLTKPNRDAAIAREIYKNTYHGTQVMPHPVGADEDLDDEELALRKEIAARFNWVDPVPDDRPGRFAWINQAEPSAKILGWLGCIKSVVPGPTGILVEVKITPHLVSDLGNITMANRHVFETYLYQNGDLYLVGTEEDPSRVPRMLFGD
jgi:hypothetical protein